MKENTNKPKRHLRHVYWICDKKGCKTTNNRQVTDDNHVNDDVCDYCHNRIHEPVLIELNNDQQH
jgi:hypothetical protein